MRRPNWKIGNKFIKNTKHTLNVHYNTRDKYYKYISEWCLIIITDCNHGILECKMTFALKSRWRECDSLREKTRCVFATAHMTICSRYSLAQTCSSKLFLGHERYHDIWIRRLFWKDASSKICYWRRRSVTTLVKFEIICLRQ